MSTPSSNATPIDPAADSPGSAAGSAEGEMTQIWATLAPKVLHPLKVAIIEALFTIGRPLSASDLSKSFGPAAGSLSHVSHHVRSLADAKVIKKVSDRQGRGAREKFYFFP